MSPLITVKMSLRIHPTCPPFPRARLSCLFSDERMGGPCSGSFAQDKDISTLPTRGTFLLCSDLSLTLDGQSRSGIRYLRSGRVCDGLSSCARLAFWTKSDVAGRSSFPATENRGEDIMSPAK